MSLERTFAGGCLWGAVLVFPAAWLGYEIWRSASGRMDADGYALFFFLMGAFVIALVLYVVALVLWPAGRSGRAPGGVSVASEPGR